MTVEDTYLYHVDSNSVRDSLLAKAGVGDRRLV